MSPLLKQIAQHIADPNDPDVASGNLQAPTLSQLEFVFLEALHLGQDELACAIAEATSAMLETAEFKAQTVLFRSNAGGLMQLH